MRLAFIAIILVSTAAAEPVPEQLIEADRILCEQDCVSGKVKDELCVALCGCMAGQFRKNMTRDGYITLRKELGAGAIGERNRAFLDKNGEICLAQQGLGQKDDGKK